MTPLIHLIHLHDPALSFSVREREDFVVRPAHIHSNKRYLLVQAVERVAYDSPNKGISTVNS